jgi:UDP-glucose 4-epimerase
MKKYILISGGTGFIGKYLVKKLINYNFFPIIVDNFFNSTKNSLKDIRKTDYKIIKDDIINPKLIKKIAKYNIQTIVHLAAIHFIPYCNKHKNKTITVNVGGTKNLLNIAQQKNIKNFIFISSAAVYKPSKNALSEKSQLGPIDIYGKSKLVAEKYVEKFCLKNSINYVILRLFNVYGPNNPTEHIIPSLIKRASKNSTIKVGNLDTYRDYVYLDDVIRAIVDIINLKKIKNVTYNIGTNKMHNGYEIINILEKIQKKKIIIKKDPRFYRKSDRLVLLADIKKISKETNWRPKNTLKEGINKIILNTNRT